MGSFLCYFVLSRSKFKTMILKIFLSTFIFSNVLSLPEPEAGLGVEDIVTLSRAKRAGSCKSTADCVGGNVCSKWGWCQWTTIYGEDGPSQGSAAPAGGRAGQCVTSDDCASRVPYCSKLGFCHGGRLPFDEAQLEIPDNDKTDPFEKQPQGFINNNPAKNNPNVKSGGGGNKRNGGNGQQNRGGRRQQQQSRSGGAVSQRLSGNGSRRQGGGNGGSRRQGGGKGGSCPGGNVGSCLSACDNVQKVEAYTVCVKTCGSRC